MTVILENMTALIVSGTWIAAFLLGYMLRERSTARRETQPQTAREFGDWPRGNRQPWES